MDVLAEWATPAGITIVIGGIIWAIQLNVATMNNSKAIGKLHGSIERIDKENQLQGTQLTRAVIILDALEAKLERLEANIHEHEQESNRWRQRVAVIEEKLNHIEGGRK